MERFNSEKIIRNWRKENNNLNYEVGFIFTSVKFHSEKEHWKNWYRKLCFYKCNYTRVKWCTELIKFSAQENHNCPRGCSQVPGWTSVAQTRWCVEQSKPSELSHRVRKGLPQVAIPATVLPAPSRPVLPLPENYDWEVQEELFRTIHSSAQQSNKWQWLCFYFLRKQSNCMCCFGRGKSKQTFSKSIDMSQFMCLVNWRASWAAGPNIW